MADRGVLGLAHRIKGSGTWPRPTRGAPAAYPAGGGASTALPERGLASPSTNRAAGWPGHDAHVAVQDGDRFFAQVRPGTVVPTEELDTKVKKFIVSRDLKNARNIQDFAHGRITYADLPGD